MPLDSVVGNVRIVEPRRNAYVQWKIPEFSGISLQEDNYLESPLFSFLNKSWCLRFYPHGDSQSIGWFAIYLIENKPTTSSCVLTLMIGLKFLQEDIKRGPETHTFNENDYSYGWAKIFKATEICNQSRSPYDMTIFCNVIAELPPSLTKSTAFQTFYSTPSFTSGSQKIILNEQNSNVTVEVQGHEFKLHRAVLNAHSEELSNMSRKKNLINIDDCDPDIFDIVIQFMYSGKVKNLSSDNVNKLYVVADKYSVSGLKAECVEFMENNMCADTAYDVLILAEKHKDTDLQLIAEEFMIVNFDAILPTEKWKSLMVENVSLATEIIKRVIDFYNYDRK